MSGFGSSFGSGFGQSSNTNNQQNTGFGGFGQTTPSTGGFGSTNTTGAFGNTSNTTGGGLFGGTPATSGFGSAGSGFGSGGFGAKPTAQAFGATNTGNTGGSVFGSGGTSGGFGGFGGTTSTTPAFGSSNNTGSLFGAKPTTPAFGSGAATSSPFGGTTTGFGSAGGSAFGASPATAIAGNIGECPGTGTAPFQAHVEKEQNASGNQQVAYQSIVFQQPFSKWSPEELRLVDYQQGRRFGNSNQQAGAFGTPTNFGGFGTTPSNTSGFGTTSGTGSNLFGTNNTSTSGFGQSPSTNAFGANNNTTSSLFGPKPAATGFGSTPTPSTNTLFNTGNAFGTNTNSTGFGATSTPSIFGTPNNDNKPATGAFGTGFGTQQPAATGTNTGFGAGNGLSLFGNPSQTNNSLGTNAAPPSNNLFGTGFGSTTNNQQQTNTTPSLFGAPKPATGLFGATTNTSTPSLFGTTPAAPSTSGFGTSTGTSSLFGGPPKTAPTSNLFGTNNTTNTANTTGGLFGTPNQSNQQQQQPQQTQSLFGQPQQKTSLFGNPGATGSSLFGNPSNNNSGSLFGQNNQQQQQQPVQAGNSLFGGANSLLGNSQQSQPQSLTASLNDNAAFGTASLFSNLASSDVRNPGPIATPLSSASKQKKTAQMPLYRLNPTSSSRFSTPTKRGLGGGGGYGFSYSTSPSISSSGSTPLNFSNSLLGDSLSRSLAKSMSTSSLRRQFTSDDSILAPNAFSASPSSRHFGSSTGNVKKLVINKSLRNELFTPPKDPKESGQNGKKTVRFGDNTNGINPSPLKNVQSSSSSPTPQEMGLLRSSSNGTNGTNGTARTDTEPEMQEVRGNEVAIVVEENSSPIPPKSTENPKKSGKEDMGEYSCNPTIEEIKRMSKDQRSKVKDFTVFRPNSGWVRFDGEVNLQDINLDELFESIVKLEVRKCTVYPDPATKAPRGKGLNVPSTICLEQVWPGKHSVNKFTLKLRKHKDTKFVAYDSEKGHWTFTVEHYTTYGLDDDDDDDDGEEMDVEPMDSMDEFGQSTFSAPPDTPTPRRRTPRDEYLEDSFMSQTTTTGTNTDSNVDDTFEFRKKKNLPEAFDDRGVYEEEEDADMEDEYLSQDQSFLDKRSVGSQSEVGVDNSMAEDTIYDDESVISEEQEVAGSFFSDDNTTEQGQFHAPSYDTDMKLLMPDTPALMRARLREKNTPSKSKISAGDDWMKSLQHSISPRKQDRRLLKERLVNELDDVDDENEEETPTANRMTVDRVGIATSIDLMNSLFGQANSPHKSVRSPRKPPKKNRGFARPYSQVPSANDEGSMSQTDRDFHASLKPNWGPDGLLVYAAHPDASAFRRSGRAIREKEGLLEIESIFNASDSRDIRFARFSYEDSVESIKMQKSVTSITSTNGVPIAEIGRQFKFTEFSEHIDARNPAATQEKLVWELAGALFDVIDIPEDLEKIPNIANRLRKERVSNFWQKLVDGASSRHAAMAKTSEEKAIACLSGHKIIEACNSLLAGENFHLATLVALLGNRSDAMRKDIKDQLQIWNSTQVLPEIHASVRALYEILAGNVCVCSGKKDVPREDRFETFVISTQYGLDWRQALGMRLWYAISAEQNLEEAVNLFADDLEQDREQQKPLPWYVEQSIDSLWSDDSRTKREDLLWGLLKLYSNSESENLQSILRPENSQLSPLDVRLSWQLGRALIANGRFTYGLDSDDKKDTLTLQFASQLTAQGNWLDATFVLLHLSSEVVRGKAIKEHLSRHAGKIGDESGVEFRTLTKEFKILPSWVWEAKALYMRSVRKNPRKEVECLLQAGNWEDAHRVFSSEVAPTAIIERDYDVLKRLLRGFKGRETSVDEWHLGGELYSDYLALVEGQKTHLIDPEVVDRLLAALPAMHEHKGSIMETIAIQEIAGVVAKTVLASPAFKREKSRIFPLPLTEDKCLQHTVDLALNYYRTVVATGK